MQLGLKIVERLKSVQPFLRLTTFKKYQSSLILVDTFLINFYCARFNMAKNAIINKKINNLLSNFIFCIFMICQQR